MAARVLITGMSGVGKSSVIAALRALGHAAVDADEDLSETGADGDWVWREDAVRAVLAAPRDGPLFLSGCASNQGQFYPLFSHIVLLSASLEVMRARVMARADNAFGKAPDQWMRIVGDREAVEPLLRRRANAEIDTNAPLDGVVQQVLRAAGLG